MRTVALSEIKIPPNRQRREFDAKGGQELVSSIRQFGLLHPVVLRLEGSVYFLVAGERRLKALSQLLTLGSSFTFDGESFGADRIPFTLLSDLDTLSREEAELDENIRRLDLTWQERTDAVARIHDIRVRQGAGQNIVHSSAATAAELAGGEASQFVQNHVRKQIVVARHLLDPEVAKAKSLDEAFKIVTKQERVKENIALAAAVGVHRASGDAQLIAEQANCLDWLRGYGGPLFDVLCTDPPYGIGADTFGDGGGKLGQQTHPYDDSVEAFSNLMHEWIPGVEKVLKEQAHVYQFCDLSMFPWLKDMWEAEGWYVFRTPLIAHKIDSGRVPLPRHGPRRSYECILYAFRDDKEIQCIRPDVLSHRADPNEAFGAQKPVSLFVDLLERSCRPGDRVLDTFAGTGPILAAAHALHLRATAIEQEPSTYGQLIRRVDALRTHSGVAARPQPATTV